MPAPSLGCHCVLVPGLQLAALPHALSPEHHDQGAQGQPEHSRRSPAVDVRACRGPAVDALVGSGD